MDGRAGRATRRTTDRDTLRTGDDDETAVGSMTRSMVQPGKDEDRIIRLVNQPVRSPSSRPFHARCGRTVKSGEEQFIAKYNCESHVACGAPMMERTPLGVRF
ncbi:hypothetical protein GCM10007890_18940 [Methylobacterium tardum]|uniref:Uncharacterized protein n=1 Tax=Methylobacterium tardum TaxID=374432 RepID=A0AA37WR20_9HYPH|nr:hypothetical protein GCM10007890_18940 [Methylobacterium tardum]